MKEEDDHDQEVDLAIGLGESATNETGVEIEAEIGIGTETGNMTRRNQEVTGTKIGTEIETVTGTETEIATGIEIETERGMIERKRVAAPQRFVRL